MLDDIQSLFEILSVSPHRVQGSLREVMEIP